MPKDILITPDSGSIDFFVDTALTDKIIRVDISGSVGDTSIIVFNSGSTDLMSLRSDGIFNVSGTSVAQQGFSGSLTRLVDGRSYIAAGGATTITSESNGQILIETLLVSTASHQYYGYTTASLTWDSTTWAPITGVIANETITDAISNNITRSDSTWSFVSGGVYFAHHVCNVRAANRYFALRLSGSNGTVVQQGDFVDASSDTLRGTLAGIFSASAGDTFTLEYVMDGSNILEWTTMTLDGEDLRTSTFNFFSVDVIVAGGGGGGSNVNTDLRGASAITSSVATAGGTVTGSFAVGVDFGSVWWTRVSLVSGTSQNTSFDFYSSNAFASGNLLYEADTKNLFTTKHVDGTPWSLIDQDGNDLTSQTIHFRFENSGSSDSKYGIEIVAHGT